jgi:predicted aminopeptidase
MRVTWRKFLLGVLFIFLILVAWYWQLVSYGVRQGIGQLRVVWNARPVSEVMIDPATPDSIKQKLQLIQEARQYAIDSLGLKDTENYKTLFDQKGKEIMWVITASEPFRLKEKRWDFPVLGSVPYKGFFDIEAARKEKEKLEAEGWDISATNPGGWSTLGWFKDPILSDMLYRNEGDLASLIIHEMVHSTIFIKDSIDFNENLASFIGDLAAVKFVIYKYGKNSEEHLTYINEDLDFRKYNAHVLRGAILLDSVYASIENLPLEKKQEAKKKAMTRIVETMDTLTLFYNKTPSKRFEKKLPNNSYFLSFRRYQSKQMDLTQMFERQFKSDFKTMVDFYKEKYPFL